MPNDPLGLVRLSIFCCKSGRNAPSGRTIRKFLIDLFDCYGNAADQQDDLIRTSGDVLIDSTLQISKPPLRRIFSHAAETDFIRHEDIGGIVNRQCVELAHERLAGNIHRLAEVEKS